ncbi:MAG: cohesin domain-containing protein [bacterium]
MRTLRFPFIYFFVYLFLCLFISSPVEAASVKFDKGTVTVSVGSTFTLDAVVDAGSDQITSTDMWILYDSTLLEAQSASAAAFFPAETHNITSGKVYVAGLVTDPGTYKTGSGSVATITFKGLKNGVATITYDCRTDVSNSSKVIKNAVDPINVINCAQNGTSIITIGSGGSLTPTVAAPTAVYSSQTQPTSLPRTGFMDELPKWGMIGGLLIFTGVILRMVLFMKI